MQTWKVAEPVAYYIHSYQDKGSYWLLNFVLQKKAKKIKKGLMTRAAHKVKKTFKSKQVYKLCMLLPYPGDLTY